MQKDNQKKMKMDSICFENEHQKKCTKFRREIKNELGNNDDLSFFPHKIQ